MFGVETMCLGEGARTADSGCVDGVVETFRRLDGGLYCPVMSRSAANSTKYPHCRKHVERSVSLNSVELPPTKLRNILSFSTTEGELDAFRAAFGMLLLFFRTIQLYSQPQHTDSQRKGQGQSKQTKYKSKLWWK
jgi:hypothetical protein